MYLELARASRGWPDELEATGVEPARAERYLMLLAEAAGELLDATDPATLVERLFELIRSELRLDVFFSYRLEGGALRLESSRGLTEAQVRAGATLQYGQAVCGSVARDRQPVHVRSVQLSDDPLLTFIKEVGLNAYACTPLVWHDQLLGTLGFGRRAAAQFEASELSFIHTVCHYVSLAKHRLQMEAELRASLEMKNRLLSELNHRVRNSLQVVAGLARLARGGLAEPEGRGALAALERRIDVVGSVHQRLCEADEAESVTLCDLLRGAADVEVAFAEREEASRRVSVESAVPLALLVHEVVCAAAQAAGGRVDRHARLLVRRNGSGGLEFALEAGALPHREGLELAPALLRQLRGEWAGPPGTPAFVLPLS